METRTKIIIASLALLTVFAIGRFSSPTKIKTEVKTVEIEKVVTIVKHETITITEKPDGAKETVIVTDTNTDSKSNSKATDTTKEVTGSKSTLNISILAGVKFPIDQTSVVYGASITKQIIGPFTATAWGLSNLSGGIGIGLNL
jgi:hypothetical protein